MLDDLNPMTLFSVLVTIGALAGVAAVSMALLRRDRQAVRLKAVAERRRQLAAQNTDTLRAKSRPGPKKKKSAVQEMLEKLKLLQADSTRELKRKLMAAGWRDPGIPAKFVAATLGLPIGFAGIAALYVTGPLAAQPVMVKAAIAAGAAAFGFFLPRILLTNAINKRRTAITKAFPDALDLMVICVEAGVSVEAAFNRVTEEMIGSAPELAEEVGLAAAELAFLPDRRQAFENLADRTGIPAVKSLATTLLQSEKYGTPVAVGLRVLSQENREARMAAVEKKAAALPAQLTVPMILFFLPVLFLVIAGPAAIRVAGL